MSNNTNIVISQALMMRIKNYAERALDRKDVTVDIAMAEIRCTDVDDMLINPAYLGAIGDVRLTLMTNIFIQADCQ